jgi:hypothetical protein
VRDGTRRHLIGAGIRLDNNNDDDNDNTDTADVLSASDATLNRRGLPVAVARQLESITNYHDALHCLNRYGFYPVHGAGVERMLLVLRHVDGGDDTRESAHILWDTSIPRYTETYYSSNSGINALIRYAES